MNMTARGQTGILLVIFAITIFIAGSLVNANITWCTNGLCLGERPQVDFVEGDGIDITAILDADQSQITIANSFTVTGTAPVIASTSNGSSTVALVPCSDAEVYQYSTGSAAFECALIAGGGGGGGTVAVQESDATVTTTADTLDFGAGFDVSLGPGSEVNITLDYTEDAVILTGAEVTGTLDISDHTNLATSAPVTLTGDTIGLALLTTGVDADSSATSSDSFLEVVGGSLTWLRGCANGEGGIWTEATDKWGCGSVGGGSQNLFETFNAPAGTDPVADSATDTLNITTSDSFVVVTGTAATDTLDITGGTAGGDLTGSYPNPTIDTNAVALATDTTGAYVATVADAGSATITVAGSGGENAAVTLDAVDLNCTNCIGQTEITDDYVLNAGDVMTGTLDLNDGVTDSPDLRFTPATGAIYDIFVEDSSDDLRIESNTGTSDILVVENVGGGTLGLYIEGPVQFAAFDCTVNTSGGTLTTDASGNLVCQDDDTGGGGANSFETINATLGTDPVADSATDTLIVNSASSTIAITGNATTDTLTLDVFDVSCTDCLNATEIEDIYILIAGDTMTGNLVFDDGTTDSPRIDFNTGDTAEDWFIFNDDTTDALQIESNEAALTEVRIEYAGAGGLQVTIQDNLTLEDTGTDPIISFEPDLTTIGSDSANGLEIILGTADELQITQVGGNPYEVRLIGGADSGTLQLDPGTGTAWEIFVEDAGDDLQIETNTASTETLDIVNVGAGDVDLTIDGSVFITSLNCTGNSNGGAVTATSTGELICSDDDSAGSLAVQEADSTVDASVTTLDFGAGFDVTSSPAGEANVVLDYTEDPVDLASAEITGSLDISANTNLAVSGTLLDLTGDTLSINEGTLTDEALCMFEATGTQIECTITSKATLETQITDVADFAEADGDVYTGVHDFGGATSIEIVNASAPTVSTDGVIAQDTTADQIIFGAEADVLDHRRSTPFTLENPADADNFLMGKLQWGITITDVHCIVDPADTTDSVILDIQERDSSGDSPVSFDAAITCDNDGAEDDGALTNPTFDASDWWSFDIGTVSGTVTQLSGTVYYTIVRE